jgi:uncharacterized paraquat-inducible protein A
MIECPHCYRIFRTTPEKVGARCPKCRLPLFERSSKRRPTDKDLGLCARHPQSTAVAKCTRCGRLMCITCRTRWHEEATCPECIDRVASTGEPTPQETQRQERHAWTGLVLAVAGWFMALLVLWPLVSLRTGSGGAEWWVRLGTFFFFCSFVPALVALGQSAAALRLRGPQKVIATCGLVSSGTQIGLLVGVIVLNLWHN